jgi:protein-tyrosine phosphatase
VSGLGQIVTLTEEPLPDDVKGGSTSINYIYLPVKEGEMPSAEQLATFIKVAREAIDQGGLVAVHCEYGINRTGTAMLYWLVCGQYYAPGAAIRRVHACRGCLPMYKGGVATEVTRLLKEH